MEAIGDRGNFIFPVSDWTTESQMPLSPLIHSLRETSVINDFCPSAPSRHSGVGICPIGDRGSIPPVAGHKPHAKRWIKTPHMAWD